MDHKSQVVSGVRMFVLDRRLCTSPADEFLTLNVPIYTI